LDDADDADFPFTIDIGSNAVRKFSFELLALTPVDVGCLVDCPNTP
jgi:hypothetical protein